MTAHELAKKLLEGPDLPVTRYSESGDHSEITVIGTDDDAFWTERGGLSTGTHLVLS